MFSLLVTLSSTNILALLALALLAAVFAEYLLDKKKTKKIHHDGLLEAPTPKKWPVIGHLHLMGGYEVPYQAFSALGRKYGSVVNLQLGNIKCVVINGQKNVREALVTKGHHFDSRPNFQRYHELFSGNKENSLAFCDWSDAQKAKRDMLKVHTFPRAFTNKFSSLEGLISESVQSIVTNIKPDVVTDVKPIILTNITNIFTSHFCSKKFSVSNVRFVQMVEDFDEIFWEINQGHAADFLPFLMPLHKRNMARIHAKALNIRKFFEDELIGTRYEDFDVHEEPNDYVESLIKYVKSGESPDLSWDAALFALEDIVGGQSAVGNFLVKVLAYLVNEPGVQRKIQDEIDATVSRCRQVTIDDKNSMPYTDAVIFEAIRLIASPIVPRVANQDSSVDGYRIEKGSVLFLNNYDLSMSEKLWDQPEKFLPERFIKDGRVLKPEHFLPFGGGRRACLGYRMVQLISFGVLGGLMQHFNILPVHNEVYKVPVGSLALKKDTFKFKFTER